MRFLFLFLFTSIANAAIIDVTSNITDPNDGVCDLYSAILSANNDTANGGCNAGSGSDTIRLNSNVAFDRTLPSITTNITIQGWGSKRTIEPLSPFQSRIFETGIGSTTNIINLVLRGGDSGANPGGCIYNRGNLSISSSNINFCSASDGGAVYSESADLSISSSTFNGNTANFAGSAIYGSGGSVTIANSSVSNGSVAGSAVYTLGLTAVEISNTSIHGNSGNGVENNNSTSGRPNILIDRSSITSSSNTGLSCNFADCTIVNSTIANNSNIGIQYSSSMVFGGVDVDNSTLYNNGSGNIRATGGSSTIRNTALGSSFSPSPSNCSGTLNGSDNVSDDTSCSSINASVVTNLGLSGLSYNNQTYYYVPSNNSPLVGNGSPVICANSYVNNRDQIFTARPSPTGTNCDVGAIEISQTMGGNNPSISLIKTGVFNDESNDGYAQAGETITYSFTVENDGDQTLTSVSISDPLVTVSGSVPSMAPGAIDNSTFSATYTLLQSDVDNGQVDNTATVSGFNPAFQIISDSDSHSEVFPEPPTFADISLTKTGVFNDESNDGYAQAGETITYSFTVENTGTQTLTNVNITDPLVNVPGSLPSMAPGAVDNSTFSATYTLLQSDVDNGQVDNTATASGTGDDDTVNDNDSHSEVFPEPPTFADISLIKTGVFNDESNDGYAQAGETITYSFTVENTGTQTLTNVNITDPLVNVPGSLPSMAPGAVDNSTFSATYTLLQSDVDNGQVDNTATASGTGDDDTVNDNDSHSESFGFVSEIDLLKFGVFDDNNNDGYAQAGETVSYTFTVENTGGATLTNVTVNDPLFTVTGSVSSMAPGDVDSSTFSGVYTLTQLDVDAGEVSNLATVTGFDPSTDIVTDQSNNGVDLITPLPANNSISLIKDGNFNDESNDGYAQAGETITYSFTVENTGTQTLTNVTITDPLFTVPGSIPSMAPGAIDSSTFSGTYTLLQSDVDNGRVDNTATVEGTDPQNDSVVDSDSHSEVLPGNPGIQLTKTGQFNDTNNNNYADAGETITYSFTVENIGTQVLTNVSISDPLITVPGSIPSMAPGAVDNSTFSATYTLLQSDVNNGQVDNTATVEGTDPQNETVVDSDTHSELLPINTGIVLIKTGVFNDENEDGYAQIGETITYGFSVENISSQTLSNIVLNDPLITVNGSLQSMSPGMRDDNTFWGTYTLTQADIDAEQVFNTATVEGATPQNDVVSDTDTHLEPLSILVARGETVQVPVNNPYALIILGLLMVAIMRRKLIA